MPALPHPAAVAGMLALSLASADDEVRLVIAHTWDGQAADTDERVTLRLGPVNAEAAAIRMEIEAPFHGDPPPPGAPGSFDGLWRYEVVELFIADAEAARGDGTYTEIEVSPHGHYLVLRLAGVRRVVEKGRALDLETSIQGGRWHATATISLTYLPPPPWTANAYAIHGTGAERRYLAMIPVPGDTPDFHRPEVFRRLDLGPP